MSIEDRPLQWIIVRSQTYYPEHIFAYGSRKARYALVIGSGSFRNTLIVGSGSFSDQLIGDGERWRSKHHIETGS